MKLIALWMLIAVPAWSQTFSQPFSSNSIWNTPIQDGADIVTPSFTKSNWFLVFEEYVVNESLASATLRDVRDKSSVDYCIANVTATVHYQMRIPDAYTNTTKGLGNGIGVWVETDHATVPGRIREGYMWQRCTASGVIAQQFAGNHGGGVQANVDGFNIYGNGRVNVSSAMGAWEAGGLGGVIREGELITVAGTFPQHAIRIVLSGEFLYNQAARGWRWPAFNEDGWFTYTGTEPNARMGSVFTFARGTTPDSLGLITEPAKKLFWAIYYYGAYPVDSFNNPDTWGIGGPVIQKRHSGSGGNTVNDEMVATYGIDLVDAGGAGYNNTQTQNFHDDVALMFTNFKVLANSSVEWPKGPPNTHKLRLKHARLYGPKLEGAQLLQPGDRKNPTQI